MKKLIVALLFLSVAPLVRADELKIKGHIKPDPVRSANHYLITNDDGRVKARLKPDPTRPSAPGHYIIIDRDENQNGRIKPDYINSGSYIIETADEKKNMKGR